MICPNCDGTGTTLAESLTSFVELISVKPCPLCEGEGAVDEFVALLYAMELENENTRDPRPSS